MLAAIKNFGKKDIVKVFSLNAISTLIKMLTGFVSVKVVAILIGPSGIALVGQLYNFTSICLTISTGGINSGVTKYVAELHGSSEKITVILSTASWITLILSLFTGLSLIVGSTYFAQLILHDVQYSNIFFVFGFTIIFYSSNGLLLSILNGFKEFKKFVIINITSSISGLLFSVVLVYYTGVFGALLSAVTFQSIVFIVTVYFIITADWFKKSNFFGKFNKSAAKKFAHYSLMALVSAATVPVTQLAIRSFLSEQISLSEAGVWEGMNRISGMYLMVITSSLAVYYLPRLSEIKNPVELREEILSTYRIILPPLIILCAVIFFLRDVIVNLLFDEKFEGMRDLFLFQLVGDFFKIASWIIAFLMISKSLTKTYVITEIIFSLISIGSSLFFIKLFDGKIGATIGYSVTSAAYFFSMLCIFRKILLVPNKAGY